MAKVSDIEEQNALAAKFFFDGKMQEFLGYLELGNEAGVKLSREEMHELLDIQLNALKNAHAAIKREADHARRRRTY